MAQQDDDDVMIVDHGPNVKKLTDGNGAGQLFHQELSLFEEPPLLAAVASEEFVDYRPTSASLNAGSLDYSVPISSSQMVDLRSSRHHFTFKIVHASDGSDVDEISEPLVGPINFIGATLWETVQMYINQTLVTPSGAQNIPYRVMIEALLDSSRFKRDTEMQAGLYYEDLAGQMGPDADPDLGNTGFQMRCAYTGRSKKCQVLAALPVDLAQQPRLILNGVQLGFRFFPSRPEFNLMTAPPRANQAAAPGGYKLEILDAFLRIKKKTLVPSVLLGIESTLSQTPALYPLMRSEVRRFLIHRGQLGFTFDDLFQGSVPSIMILAFVNERASAGDVSKNPFEFSHCHITDLVCTLDDRTCAQPPLKMHFDELSYLNSSYMDAYQTLFLRDGGSIDDDSSTYTGIGRKEYANGYSLFKFVFSSAANSRFLPLVSRGNMRLAGNFGKALAENTSLIVYARFPSLLTLDQTRRVTF